MTKKKMTDVEKSIFEESEKINTIKAKVKARVSKIDDFALVEEQLSTDNWKDKEFQFTNNTVRLGTLFSGIGAIEHAFQRLKIKHEIVFAGDIDEKCKQSYFANYEINENNWFTDIREFDATK